MKVGLTAAEACGLLATYAPLSGVTLEVMQEGIALLSDELEVAPQHMAKVLYGHNRLYYLIQYQIVPCLAL